ncbi:MAG: tetratricopeptide repeat protein [Polyangiaceae bacterium]
MESSKAGLISLGAAVHEALASETDATRDVALARARLLHDVTHGRLQAPSSTLSLWLNARVLACFFTPIALAVAAVVWLARPISFAVVGAGANVRLGDLIEASSDVPLQFSEGSRLLLARETRARVLSADSHGARVLLESGKADVSIEHRLGKRTRWQLEAGPFHVRVTGTRFQIAWDPEERAFRLATREGAVVVSSRCLTAPRRVGANQELALHCPPIASTPNEPSAAPALPTLPLPSASATLPTPARAAARSSFDPNGYREALAASRWEEAMRLAEQAGYDEVLLKATSTDLVALANAARFSGRPERAVQTLTALRARFTGSPEAGTAAFTLGRIAFDQHSDYATAARWFGSYLAEQPSGPLMGDAFGRLMEAHQRQGDHAAARADAERYLERFPQGPYAQEARKIMAD